MTYTPRLAPRAHQTEGLRRVAARPRHPSPEDVFAWLMDMGTGKTKVMLDEWGERVGELPDLLVIAPAGAYRNWDRDRPGEPGELTKQLDPDLRAGLVVAPWVSGGGWADERAVVDLLATQDRPRVLVLNVEALSSVKRARQACEEFLRPGRAMMVVDESTTIKSPTTKRTKEVIRLGSLARARRIATGLVTPRSPLDLFSQFEFLDWRILGFKSYFGFRARYAVMKKMVFGGRTVNIVVGYRNVSELQYKIAPYSYRVLKEDCLDLEPKVYESRDVPLTSEQLKMYKDIRDYATTALGEDTHVTATSVITQIMRLHQLVCGHVVDELGHVHPVPERRTEVLLQLLEEHGGKAVIWVEYGESLRQVTAAIRQWARKRAEDEGWKYDPGMVAEFWGGNRVERGEQEHRFKTDPRCRWMVATPGAGGKGNTWVVADLVVYYANSYDLEKRSQSEDRAHRDGQTRSVTYMDLIARGTVDEKIVKSLREKINLATAINGENYREWLI